MPTLHWFRNDLRLADNPGLHAAAAPDDGVVGVFVCCPGQWAAHDLADVRIDFVRRTLEVLSDDLEARKIALRILVADTYDDVAEALLGLARQTGCDRLHFNACYEVNEGRRDDAVKAAFEAAGIEVAVFHDQCLRRPGTVRTGAGAFYGVFTPFKKNLLGQLRDEGLDAPKPRARTQSEMIGEPSGVPTMRAEAWRGFEAADDAMQALWPGGEAAAAERLDRFVDGRLATYDEDRDLAAEDRTSRLSPYLAVGAISVRTCLAAAADANDGVLMGGAPGIDTWISELVWRDFYRHVVVGWPRVSMHRAYRRETEGVAWRDDDAGFEAWCAGRTGYPIVDAGMRQLAAEGWMHNRLRMIVAAFLTKDLLIDWRRGERHFMRHLVDGDLASNNGGWQWSASTGTDAQPYFRIFNPASQAKRYDAEGAYIRRWVPELAELPAKRLHAPVGPTRGSLADAVPGYPAPIVDHAEARDRTLAAFKRAKEAAS